jgi:hypothetical protein
MSTCFVAGIVKGLVEADDPTRHFASLMAFKSHCNDAKKCGVVSEDLKVTDKGREWYARLNMAALPVTRAYLWGFPESHWDC